MIRTKPALRRPGALPAPLWAALALALGAFSGGGCRARSFHSEAKGSESASVLESSPAFPTEARGRVPLFELPTPGEAASAIRSLSPFPLWRGLTASDAALRPSILVVGLVDARDPVIRNALAARLSGVKVADARLPPSEESVRRIALPALAETRPLSDVPRESLLPTSEGGTPRAIEKLVDWWPYLGAFGEAGVLAVAKDARRDRGELPSRVLVEVLRVDALRNASRAEKDPSGDEGRRWSDAARAQAGSLARLGCPGPRSCADAVSRYFQEFEARVAFPYVWRKKSAADVAVAARALGIALEREAPGADVELWDDVAERYRADAEAMRGARELMSVARSLEALLRADSSSAAGGR